MGGKGEEINYLTLPLARLSLTLPPLPFLLRTVFSHLIGIGIVWGGRILRFMLHHSPLRSTNCCILSCLLYVRVLPGSCGPLLLGFAETPSTPPVKFMHLCWEQEIEKKKRGCTSLQKWSPSFHFLDNPDSPNPQNPMQSVSIPKAAPAPTGSYKYTLPTGFRPESGRPWG